MNCSKVRFLYFQSYVACKRMSANINFFTWIIISHSFEEKIRLVIFWENECFYFEITTIIYQIKPNSDQISFQSRLALHKISLHLRHSSQISCDDRYWVSRISSTILSLAISLFNEFLFEPYFKVLQLYWI